MRTLPILIFVSLAPLLSTGCGDDGEGDGEGGSNAGGAGTGNNGTGNSGTGNSGTGNSGTGGMGSTGTGTGVGTAPTNCVELCALAPVDDATGDCVTAYLVTQGYDFSTPACAAPNTNAGCNSCYDTVNVADSDCVAVYGACF